MSDGTTAVQVSPIPTENEMQSFRTMLDRALNAIVQASELAKVVSELRVELDGLKHEINTVRDNNRWLDEQLSRVRSERDEAKASLEQTRSELSQVTRQKEYTEEQAKGFQEQIARLSTELAQAKSERDDYGMKHMQATDDLTKANAKLAEIKSFASALISEDKPLVTEAKPEADKYVAQPEPPIASPEPYTVTDEPWKKW